MQLGVDVTCMHTNFGGCGCICFRDIATFKNGQISLSDHGLFGIIVHGGQKIEMAQNIYASKGGCETHANQFWWAWHLQFWRFCPFSLAFKNGQISLLDYYSGQKIELTQKIHASGVDVKCMHTNFDGCGFSGFEDNIWLKKLMQVGMNVKYMHTNFGGGGFSSFRDFEMHQ